jgi:hypothetical protein
LESRANPASDYTIGFLDATNGFDDAFFQKSLLILIILEEPSGSNRHKVTDLDQEAAALTIRIERQVPQVGTADMAEWHLILELKISDFHNQAIKVLLSDRAK